MSMAGHGKVERQIVLPLRKAVVISFKSLRMRFWRSLITTGGIILGIAFLMAVLTATQVEQGLRAFGSPETRALLQTHAAESQAKTIWLVSLSLLVSIVGITNAMLMSVTERYREIGTMKCLGALDSFVRKLFLLESLFQGLLGSLAGVLIGVGFSLPANLFKYGFEAVTCLEPVKFMLAVAACLATGVVIAVIGALLPASQAARMVPAAAMRSEI
jgi:predicted lysophospholipase L1 biosynthesis ABC-type transport system permease subunit